jgi:DNA end-binding protein Ku
MSKICQSSASREHVIALEPRGKGLMGTLLRYPYEVRDESEYFDDIPAGQVTKDMLEFAKHIVQTKSGHFQPEKFEDHYETALKELLKKKQAGQTITPAKETGPTNVVNLMDALRKSVQAEGGTARATTKRAAAGRKSSSKKAASTKQRKAGRVFLPLLPQNTPGISITALRNAAIIAGSRSEAVR